jgi:hypothetical protein
LTRDKIDLDDEILVIFKRLEGLEKIVSGQMDDYEVDEGGSGLKQVDDNNRESLMNRREDGMNGYDEFPEEEQSPPEYEGDETPQKV